MRKTLALLLAAAAASLLSGCSINPWSCSRPVAAGSGADATGLLDLGPDGCDDGVCARPAVASSLASESFLR